jgi:hypothetical protein
LGSLPIKGAEVGMFAREEIQDSPAKIAYLCWRCWVERIARRLGVELLEEDPPRTHFSEEYCRSVGAAFEESSNNISASQGSSSNLYARQILLYWLGICIREESLEKFQRFVLSSYSAVSGGEAERHGTVHISDEIRASLFTFTDPPGWMTHHVNKRKENGKRFADSDDSLLAAEGATAGGDGVLVLDRCTEAPLFAFIAEWTLFRKQSDLLHEGLKKPLFSPSALCARSGVQPCMLSTPAALVLRTSAIRR